MKKQTKTKDPVQEAIDFGIDVTLLYKNLKLTVTERIEQNLNFLRIIEELRRAGKKKFVRS